MISGVPAEYETRSFKFEQKENKMVGHVHSTGRREMKDLTIDQGKVLFQQNPPKQV